LPTIKIRHCNVPRTTAKTPSWVVGPHQRINTSCTRRKEITDHSVSRNWKAWVLRSVPLAGEEGTKETKPRRITLRVREKGSGPTCITNKIVSQEDFSCEKLNACATRSRRCFRNRRTDFNGEVFPHLATSWVELKISGQERHDVNDLMARLDLAANQASVVTDRLQSRSPEKAVSVR
jgi:hypothetical protein